MSTDDSRVVAVGDGKQTVFPGPLPMSTLHTTPSAEPVWIEAELQGEYEFRHPRADTDPDGNLVIRQISSHEDLVETYGQPEVVMVSPRSPGKTTTAALRRLTAHEAALNVGRIPQPHFTVDQLKQMQYDAGRSIGKGGLKKAVADYHSHQHLQHEQHAAMQNAPNQPSIADQAVAGAMQMFAPNKPVQTTAHELRIMLLQETTQELAKKGLRPGTRNFRRMFKKRTDFDYNALVEQVRTEIRVRQAAMQAAEAIAGTVAAQGLIGEASASESDATETTATNVEATTAEETV